MNKFTDIDPAQAKEILPSKIENTQRAITETALDLSVISGVPNHSDVEVTGLKTRLVFLKDVLAGYQGRLEEITQAETKAAHMVAAAAAGE